MSAVLPLSIPPSCVSCSLFQYAKLPSTTKHGGGRRKSTVWSQCKDPISPGDCVFPPHPRGTATCFTSSSRHTKKAGCLPLSLHVPPPPPVPAKQSHPSFRFSWKRSPLKSKTNPYCRSFNFRVPSSKFKTLSYIWVNTVPVVDINGLHCTCHSWYFELCQCGKTLCRNVSTRQSQCACWNRLHLGDFPVLHAGPGLFQDHCVELCLSDCIVCVDNLLTRWTPHYFAGLFFSAALLRCLSRLMQQPFFFSQCHSGSTPRVFPGADIWLSGPLWPGGKLNSEFQIHFLRTKLSSELSKLMGCLYKIFHLP